MSTSEHKKLQIEKLQKYEGQTEYTKYQKTNSTSDLNQKLSTRRTAEKKVDSSFPFSLNSTKVAQPDLAAILEQRRKVREMDIEISPEIAAIVVKQYLIPMFKVGDRNMNDKKRKNILGLTQEDETLEKEMDPIKGSVLQELKLSEKLLQELKLAKNALRIVTQKLKDLEQSMIGMKNEIQQANNLKIQADVDIQLINYQSNLNYQESSSKLLEIYIDQIQSLEQKCKESEDKRIQFANLLYNEKALNDKLKNKANELEHGNTILKLENDIMGERLKNLYQSINEMLNRKFLEEKLQNEMKAIAISIQKLINFHQNLLEQITSNLQKFDNLKEDLSEMTRYRKELLFEHKQLVHKSKEKINKLEINLENLKEENINLTLQVTDLNKKNADISEQYEQLRTKMKQYKSRFNKYTVSEEKICKNCNKYFVEKENFNWSCSTHHAQWSEENKIYFCCGETNQWAPGCRVQKHESKDDEDETDIKEKEEQEKRKAKNVKCNACNETGHKTIECSKDPNIRHNYEVIEELNRIQNLDNKEKGKNKTEAFALRQKVIKLMSQKFEQSSFGVPQISSIYLTESESEVISPVKNQASNLWTFEFIPSIKKTKSQNILNSPSKVFTDQYIHKKGFSDILEKKPEIQPQNNLIKIDLMLTKEYAEAYQKSKGQKAQITTNINDLYKFVSGQANVFQIMNEHPQDITKPTEQSIFETLNMITEKLAKKKQTKDLSSARTIDEPVTFAKNEFQSETMILDEKPCQEITSDIDPQQIQKIRKQVSEESDIISSSFGKKPYQQFV